MLWGPEMMPLKVKSVYPTKEKRLGQLEEWGLNIADFISFPSGGFDETKARQFFEKHGSASVRTFSNDEQREYKGPVKYEIADFDEVKQFCEANNSNWNLLINQTVSRADALITGNIMLDHDGNYCIEYFLGSGTPRDVEDEEKTIMRVNGNTLERQTLSEDQEINQKLKRLINETQFVGGMLGTGSVILEFQFYPYSVGKGKTELIFWEWREG